MWGVEGEAGVRELIVVIVSGEKKGWKSRRMGKACGSGEVLVSDLACG